MIFRQATEPREIILDFVFKPSANQTPGSLCQGDVLEKTDDLIEVLKQAHGYYADAADYTHFVVITQSCDLVRRGNKCKAPYITLAAAKPMRPIIEQELNARQKKVAKSDFTYQTTRSKRDLEMKLEKYLHNTVDEHFFLPCDGSDSIPEDLIVFLRLSVALSKDHYEAMLVSKVAELEDVFQAKLGWLKGNIYSRVATPAFEEKLTDSETYKQAFFEKYLPDASIVWLSGLQADLLKTKVSAKAGEKKGDLNTAEVVQILEVESKPNQNIIAERVVERLISNKVLPADDGELLDKARRVISNVPTIKNLANN